MPYLFSYGTLQHVEIQQSLFGRELIGYADTLAGYVYSKHKAYGQYPLIKKTKNKAEILEGMVYQVSNSELKKADEYEGKQYKRVEVNLASGKKAWVYLGVKVNL